MKKYRFYVTVQECGTIEVEAPNKEKAEELVYAMEGKYRPNITEVIDCELIKE